MKNHAATLLLATAAWMPTDSVSAGEAEIISEMQRQIARCWVMPPQTDSRTDPVTLTFRLGRDGSVQGVPMIVKNPDVLEYSKLFVISASKAIETCQPYHLPPDQYEIWKEVKITFRPPEN